MSTSLVNETENIQQTFWEKDKALCWVLAIPYLCIAFVAVVGNALVLYVSVRHRNYGTLKHFDCVIKSLAVADMLYGLLGMPLRVVGTNLASRGLYKKIAVIHY